MTTDERLVQLERKNKRLTLALVFLGTVAILAVTMGQSSPPSVPKEISANKFILTGSNGELLAILGMGKFGPGLFLYDENGKNRIDLSVYRESSSVLRLKDQNGNSQASLWVDKDSTSLSLGHERGETQTMLSVDKTGTRFSMRALGKSMASIILSLNKFKPFFLLLDENGHVLQSLPSIGRQPPRSGTKEEYRQLPRGSSPAFPERNNLTTPAPDVPSAIESRIDGEFEGWDGETVVKLANGQVWQQSDLHIEIHLALNPKVIIYRSGSVYKMMVEGTRKAVEVQRLK
jgi:hypothetical protein